MGILANQTSKQAWQAPRLMNLGSLAATTRAGAGTIPETNWYYTKGAPTCAKPNAANKATCTKKHPCG